MIHSLDTRISLCIMGNNSLQVKEHGLNLCSLEEEHQCPFKDKIRYLKAYETIFIDHYLCRKWE